MGNGRETGSADDLQDVGAVDQQQDNNNNSSEQNDRQVFDLNVVGLGIGFFKIDDPDTLEDDMRVNKPFILKWQVNRLDQLSTTTPAYTDTVLLDGQPVANESADPLPPGMIRWNQHTFEQGIPPNTDGSTNVHGFNVMVNSQNEVTETNTQNNLTYPQLTTVLGDPPTQNSDNSDSSDTGSSDSTPPQS
jgi:hypothetical protein